MEDEVVEVCHSLAGVFKGLPYVLRYLTYDKIEDIAPIM